MRIIKPNYRGPILYAYCSGMLGFFVPWYLALPGSWRLALGPWIMLLGFAVPAFAAGTSTWLRQRSHEILLEGDSSIWYRVGGNVIWGGPLDAMSTSRRGLRRIVTDSAGRKIAWEQISMRFDLPRSLKPESRAAPRPEEISKRGSALFVWSLVVFTLGVATSFVCMKFVRDGMEREAFTYDWAFMLALTGTCVGQVAFYGGLFGMIAGLRGVLPARTVETLNASSRVAHAPNEPVVMEPGVRYVYDDPEQLLKWAPGPVTLWLAFGIMAALATAIGLYLLVSNSDPVQGIGGLATGVVLLSLGGFLATRSANFRRGAFDEFELERSGQLIVHRNGGTRTLHKVGETLAANKTAAWGQWCEKYRDHLGVYCLDTRYLVEKRR